MYFSCAGDMPLLTMSLKSLSALSTNRIGNVFVVVDSKAPFTPEQEIDLRSICPELRFLHLGRIDWASVETLHTELRAFSTAARSAAPHDFIAKVDSDILFFSALKLEEISVSRFDFVGDGHYSDYSYAQGGLYFIRADKAVPLAESVSGAELQSAMDRCGSISEDRVMSALLAGRCRRIWMTRVMLFPNEYEKASLRGGWVRREFSAIHFVRRKADMPGYSKAIGLARPAMAGHPTHAVSDGK